MVFNGSCLRQGGVSMSLYDYRLVVIVISIGIVAIIVTMMELRSFNLIAAYYIIHKGDCRITNGSGTTRCTGATVILDNSVG